MKIKIYISHSIRGKHGKNATKKQMRENNDKAILFHRQLKRLYPTTDFYCPGEHDEFVLIAYTKGFLSEEQVLQVDCDIVATCNLLLNYSPDRYISKGMKVENDYAVANGIPIITLTSTQEQELRKINRFLESLLK